MHEMYLSDRMLARIASDVPTPEEALIAEEGETWLASSPSVPKRPGFARAALAVALRELPEQEAIALGLSLQGVSQRDIAAELGVTQGAVWKSVRRGTLRLRWLTGPATWFAPVDVDVDLGPTLGIDTARLLGTLWETTSQTVTARRLRCDRREVHERFSGLMSGELRSAGRFRGFGRYVRGFTELRSWGQGLLAPRSAHTDG